MRARPWGTCRDGAARTGPGGGPRASPARRRTRAPATVAGRRGRHLGDGVAAFLLAPRVLQRMHAGPPPLALQVESGALDPAGAIVRPQRRTEPALRFEDGTVIQLGSETRGRLARGRRPWRARRDRQRQRPRQRRAQAAGALADRRGSVPITVHGTVFSASWDEVPAAPRREDGARARLGRGAGDQRADRRARRSGADREAQALAGLAARSGSRRGRRGRRCRRRRRCGPAAAAPPKSMARAHGRRRAAGAARARVAAKSRARRARTWTAALSAGDFDTILDEAERDIGHVLATRGTDDLAALADAARYRRHDDVARRALLAQRRRFAGSPRAADAAFFLGRLDENGGRGHGPALRLVRTLSRRGAARLVRGGGAGPQDDRGRGAATARAPRATSPSSTSIASRTEATPAPRTLCLARGDRWFTADGAPPSLTAFAAAALSPDVASAQPPTAPAPKVILLRPAAVPATVSEALVRLQAELTVEGFDAQVTEVDLGTDVRASLERMAPTMAATALVAVVDGRRSRQRRAVGRRSDDGQDGGPPGARRIRRRARIAEVLSVRAVELLRASFLELAITRAPRPTSSRCRCPPRRSSRAS